MNSAPRPSLSTALAGCTIVIAVDRRSSELAAALERHGASVRQAPALTIVSHIDDESLLAATQRLIAQAPDIVVATTGVGFRGWMEAAEEAGLLESLRGVLEGARIIARGPKARGAIQQAGFSADWVAESETAAEIGDYLVSGGISGQRIAVQHHGSGSDGLDGRFAAAGADVVSLTVYRWGPPADPMMLSSAVEATSRGEVDAVLFTSAPGAAGWQQAAARDGHLEQIISRSRTGRVLMAAVGPITAAPLRDAGFDPLVAERGRLGSLVRAVVTYFGDSRAPSLLTSAGLLELRSSGAILNRRYIPLSRTGISVLGTLFAAGGGIVSRDQLREVLARPGEDTHAVEVAIGRLREAICPELIRTVVKRGYRLDVAATEVASETLPVRAGGD